MHTMKNVPHPVEIIREDVIAALGIAIGEAAERLSVSRVALSRVVNARAAISPELAYRLEKAGVSTARFWLAMQANYDLQQIEKQSRPRIKSLAA